MEPDVRANRQESRRGRPRSAFGPYRVRNGGGRSGSAMDHELLSCRDWHSLPQVSQARNRYWRNFGNLSRLPGFQGLHLTVRADLDQGNGETSGVNPRFIFLNPNNPKLAESRVEKCMQLHILIGKGLNDA